MVKVKDKTRSTNKKVSESISNECRSLVPLQCRTIALYPPSAQRNLHPSASTCHLHPSVSGDHSHGYASGYTFPLTAIQQFQFPVVFEQLENATDVRFSVSAHLERVPVHRPLFCSFQLAHKFVDIVRRVDVVSDAENIKELLKMPFSSNNEVSLLVHRVGGTLLIDQFSRTFLDQERSDLEWMKAFQIAAFKALRKMDGRNDEQLEEMNPSAWQLLNRFLQITIAQQQQSSYKDMLSGQANLEVFFEQAKPTLDIKSSNATITCVHTQAKLSNSSETVYNEDQTTIIPFNLIPGTSTTKNVIEETNDVLSGPEWTYCSLDGLDGINDSHVARNIIWNFEDLRMLLGTDLPIFGGDTRPCVSLRLADMCKPINILTGLDYWLDNLMCNVPEVAMCFHLSGIVQKYERIKTEELPELLHSKFSPELVKDIAKNILAFLKDNTTHEGHTYWLLKKENDDVVKLYDLTSLGIGTDKESSKSEEISEGHIDGLSSITNPFTVHAGMLFYRMAKNILEDEETRAKKLSTISQLLHNAIRLLDVKRYPEIVSSAHYYIAELLLSGIDSNELDGIESECSSEENDLAEHESAAKSCSVVYQSQDSISGNHKKMKGKLETKSKNRQKTKRPDDVTAQTSILLSQLCCSDSSNQMLRCKYRPSRLPKERLSRCEVSLAHILEGLQCLQESASSSVQDSIPTTGKTCNKADGLNSNSNIDCNDLKAHSETIPLPNVSLRKQVFNVQEPSQAFVQPSRSASHDMKHSNKVITVVDEQDPIDNMKGTVVGVDEALIPPSNCYSVLLSSVKYYVRDRVAKLRVRMLHKMASVYFLLANTANSELRFADSVKLTEMCIRCCYASCRDLGTPSVSEGCLQNVTAYPLMEQAFLLLAVNFKHLALKKELQSVTNSNNHDASDKELSSDKNTSECLHCGWRLETSYLYMHAFLNKLIPSHYLHHMILPVKIESKDCCLVLGQYYLLLALGGRSQNLSYDKDIDQENFVDKLMLTYNNCDTCAPKKLMKCDYDPETFLGAAAPPCTDVLDALKFEASKSFNLDLGSLTIKQLICQQSSALLLADLINTMTCRILTKTHAYIPTDRSVSDEHCSVHIVQLLVLYRRLSLAFKLDVLASNVTKCIFTIGNISACLRLACKFHPNVVKHRPFDQSEDKYHKFATTKLKNALKISEMVTLSSTQPNKLDNSKKQQSGDANKKRRKMRGEKESKSVDMANANSNCVDNNVTLVSSLSLNCALALYQHAEAMVDRPPVKRHEKMSCAADLLLCSFEMLPQVTLKTHNMNEVVEIGALCASKLSLLYTLPNSSCTVSADYTKALFWRKKHLILAKDPLRSVLDHSQNIIAMSSDNSTSLQTIHRFVLGGLHFMVNSAEYLPKIKSSNDKRNKQSTQVQANDMAREKLLEYLKCISKLLQKLCHLCRVIPAAEPKFTDVKEMYLLVLTAQREGDASNIVPILHQIRDKFSSDKYDQI